MSYCDDLKSILSWYTQHVGNYDKAKWEQTVEERIFRNIGISHIPKKSAKISSELIDLDIVKGSSFHKPKSKHGLWHTTRLAVLRIFLLPFYKNWWALQTSKRLFYVFLSLYFIQILNVFLYLTNNNTSNNNASNETRVITPIIVGPLNYEDDSNNKQQQLTTAIQLSEILSPIVLMISLTILLSHISSTHSNSHKTTFGHTKSHNKYERRISNSGVGKTRSKRNQRHSSRYRTSPSRRMSTLLLSVNNLATSTAMGRSHLNCIAKKKVLESYLESNNKEESLAAIKKVFFEDERASAISNSDKDEGIYEENVFTDNINVDKQIIKSNMSKALKDFTSVGDGDDKENVIIDNDIAIDKSNEESTTTTTTTTTDIVPENTEVLKRSNLRKRNGSKFSEASTTSYGGESNISYSNNSSSEEGDIGEVDIDDEELRSKSDWTAVTTNSEDDDYDGGNIENSEDDDQSHLNEHNPFGFEFQQVNNPSCVSSDKISCTIWDDHEAKKVDLTVLDISSTIIAKVEKIRENSDYLYLGIFFSCILAILPCIWRLNTDFEIDDFDYNKISEYMGEAFSFAYGNDLKTRIMILISIFERLFLAFFTYFLLSLAEKTYKQRFLYAKIFSRLTSMRKARKSSIPHFRLNKVRNIKSWLSIRSYLQKRGPTRSVDCIVSATFIANLILIFFLSVELLKDSNRMYYLYNIEVIGWSLCLGFFLMRFMTLGSKISQKYRNLSVIITEQLNLYLRMEQKPHKKEELLVANNVLKLAADLLKEIEDPFKISSFASNPYFYNVTRLVILSAFSGVLSEMLGFKLKLYKIKIK